MSLVKIDMRKKLKTIPYLMDESENFYTQETRMKAPQNIKSQKYNLIYFYFIFKSGRVYLKSIIVNDLPKSNARESRYKKIYISFFVIRSDAELSFEAFSNNTFRPSVFLALT